MKRLFALALLVCLHASAQTAALMPVPRAQFLDANGVPLAGGLVYTCVAGSSCPGSTLVSYTDSTAGTANSNPIALDAGGMASIWLGSGAYKVVVQTSAGVTISTTDNVSGNTAISSSLLATLAASSGSSLVGTIRAGSGAVARTLSSKLADRPASVKDFGAKGDGTTDDTIAVGATVAAVHAAGGGTVYFPNGIYPLTAFPSLAGFSDVAIKGEVSTNQGLYQTILKYSGVGPTFINMQNTYNVSLDSLAINATNAAFTGTGTKLIDMTGTGSGTADDHINNCLFNGAAAPAVGVYLLDAISTAITNTSFYNASLNDIVGSDGSYFSTFSNAITIERDFFQNFTGAAILGPGQAWIIAGNTIELLGPSIKAISRASGATTVGQGVEVIGNWIGDSQSALTSPIIDVSGYGWKISGNYAGGNYLNVAVAIGPGAVGIEISGNKFENFQAMASIDPGAQNVVIQSNFWGNTPLTTPPVGYVPVAYLAGVAPASGSLQDWGNVVGTTRAFGLTTTGQTLIAPVLSGAIVGPISVTGAGVNQFNNTVNIGNPVGSPGSLQMVNGNPDQVLYGTDGTAYCLDFGKNLAGTITNQLALCTNGSLSLTGSFSATTTVNATTGFQVNGTAGVTVSGTSCTVKAISGGIITSATCP